MFNRSSRPSSINLSHNEIYVNRETETTDSTENSSTEMEKSDSLPRTIRRANSKVLTPEVLDLCAKEIQQENMSRKRNEYQSKRQKTATNSRKDRTQNKLTDSDKNFKSDVCPSISEDRDRRQTQLQDNGPVRYKQIHVTCESPHFVEDEGLSAAKSKRRTPLIG
ncbi:hypothetical protein ACROYT_G020737 [Oculina patagonica]